MYLKSLYILIICTMSLLGSDSFYYANSKKVYLTPVEFQTTNSRAFLKDGQEISYYKTQNNNLIGITNKLIVKFNNLDSFDDISEKFSLELLKNIYGNVYLFKIKNNTKILSIANELYKLEEVDYAHPNFIREAKKR